MKLQENVSTVHRINIQAEERYTIEANATAFEILSSKLYTKPYLAVQRELACNAYDAHLEAGIADQPFNIHLPTRYEPYFSIRDFGNGLNKEDLVYLYTTYFSSNKRNSNDSIGGFGLGAQSVWSITDNFTVTSINNGIKYIYIMFKNESKIPTYTLVSETKTNEKSGLEVKISVKDGDIHKYSEDASRVYKFFPVLPSFTGYQPNVTRDIPNLKGTNWYTTEALSHYNAEHCTVVMGFVSYKLDLNLIKNIGSTAKQLAKCGLTLFAEIGDLTPQASREGLSYDKQTIAKLTELLDQVEQEYSATVEKDIKAASSFYDACLIASKMPIYPNKAAYNGKALTSSQNFKLKHPAYKFRYTSWYRKKYDKEIYNTELMFTIDMFSKLVEKDLDKTSDLRCTQEVTTSGTDIYLLDKEDIDQICQFFEYPITNIRKVSSLAYTSNRVSTKVTGIYKIENHNSYSPRWRKSSVDFKNNPTGYYVGFFDKLLYHPEIATSYYRRDIGKYEYINSYLEIINIKPVEVYGVQKDKMPRFKKQNWIDILDKVYNDILALNISTEFKLYTEYNNFLSDISRNADNFVAFLANKTLTPIMSDFYNHFTLCKNQHKISINKIQALTNIDNQFFNKLVIPTSRELTNKFRSIEAHYDLLKYLFNSNVSSERIWQYINDTDRLASLI